MENNENTYTSPCCCDCLSPCGGHVYNSLPVGTWPPHCCNGCGIQVLATNVYDLEQQKWQDEINQELYDRSGSISSITAGNGIKFTKDGETIETITDTGVISIDETDVVTVDGNQDIHVNSINDINNITEVLQSANTALQKENIIGGTGIVVTSVDNGIMISNGIGPGTLSYSDLSNKPQINGIELDGNKNATTLGLVSIDGAQQISNKTYDGLHVNVVANSMTLSCGSAQGGSSVTINNNHHYTLGPACAFPTTDDIQDSQYYLPTSKAVYDALHNGFDVIPIITSGTHIATIKMNGDVTPIYAPTGGGGGVTSYNDLLNRPSIEGNELTGGNQTAASLGLLKKSAFDALTFVYNCVSASSDQQKIIYADINIVSGVRYLITMQNKNTASDVNLVFGGPNARLYYNNQPVSADNTWKDNEVIEVFYECESEKFYAKKYFVSDNYNLLSNKPRINGTELSGNVFLSDLLNYDIINAVDYSRRLITGTLNANRIYMIVPYLDYIFNKAHRCYGKPIRPVTSVTTTPSDFVDLGLPRGTKWCTRNIGSGFAYEYGEYYQWGSVHGTTDASNSSWATCPFNNGSEEFDSVYFKEHLTEVVDGLDRLLLDNDAAYYKNNSWRMPTLQDFEELVANTTQTWTDDYQSSGKAGCIFTSKTYSDRHIFIPAAGTSITDRATPESDPTPHFVGRGIQLSYWCSDLSDMYHSGKTFAWNENSLLNNKIEFAFGAIPLTTNDN